VSGRRRALPRVIGYTGRGIFAALLVVFMAAPLVGILSTSVTTSVFWEFPPRGFTLRWYDQFFAKPELVHSTFVSIAAATLVGAAGTLVGIMMGLALTRSRIGRSAREALGVLILIPLLVPSIALGLAIYTLYIQGKVPINIVTLGLAQIILVLPLITGLMATGLEGIRPNVERAGANLGASPSGVFTRVTLPLVRPVLIASAIIAFVRSFDDSAIALFVNSPDTTTLPVRMLLEMEQDTGPLSAASGLSVEAPGARDLTRRGRGAILRYSDTSMI
jgi:putative spermidine/putrescine transport system permease protein